MLKTYGFHSFIQRPHFSQYAKNLFRASFSTPSDIAAYNMANATSLSSLFFQDGQPLVTSFPEAEAEIRRLKEELALLSSRQQNGEGGDGDLIQQMESRENEKNNKIKSIEKINKNLKLEKEKIYK